MYKDKLYTCLISAVLAFTLSVSAAMCLATAFSLTVNDLSRLLLVACICALGSSLLFLWRRGLMAFLLITALLCGYLWRLGTPDRQLLALIQKISQTYDSAYHWGSLYFSDLPQSADYPLMMLVFLITGTVSHSICRGCRCWSAILPAVFPLVLCFVVTDTVPAASFLCLFLWGLGLLILTCGVRRQNASQGNRLTFMAAPLLLAALALLFWLVPQYSYVNQTDALRQRLLSAAESLSYQMETAITRISSESGDSPGDVSLSRLGRRVPSSYPVMYITAEITGNLYLRGWDCDTYTGTDWLCSQDRSETFTLSDSPQTSVTIRTPSTLGYRYLPYYPGTEVSLSGGMAGNSEKETEYTFHSGHLSENREAAMAGKQGVLPNADRYLALPQQTRTDAGQLLETILVEGETHTQTAARIAAYVRSCAEYDLNPTLMPESEPDFALWFLEEADQGYCVHFATAATVLLRAADIPARYVTGYLTRTSAGKTTTVTGRDAHAWAEYYEPRLDAWLILETTPPDPEVAPDASEETEATAPPSTLPTTASTVPTEETVWEEGPSTPEETPPTPPAEQAPAFPWLRPLLLWAVGTGLGLAAIGGQRALRLALRRRQQTHGDANDRALALWRESERLHRLLGESPGEELILLAQKAKFSQHALTGEELGQLESSLRLCRRQLKQKPWHIRLIHQYIYAAY